MIAVADSRARAHRRTAELLREGTRLPERQTVSDWADEFRIVPAETSPEPGPWRTDRVPYVRGIQDTLGDPLVRKVVWVAASQVGKALALDTPLPTPGGWTTMGEVAVGDALFDEKGQACRVLAATPVQYGRTCYRVEFSDGSSIVADADHRWCVRSDIGRRVPYLEQVMTTQEIADSVHWYTGGRRRNRHAIPVAEALQCDAVGLTVPPYALGAWLGDGHSYSTQLTVHRTGMEVVDAIEATGVQTRVLREERAGTLTVDLATPTPAGACRRGHVRADVGSTKRGGCAECARQHSKHHQYGFVRDEVVHWTLGEKLRDLGLLKSTAHPSNEKHIPAAYLRASEGDRMELLRGLMDTDGTVSKQGRCSITTTSERMRDDIYELLVSLGFKPTMSSRTAKIDGRPIGPAYRLGFVAYSEHAPFRMSRKVKRLRSRCDGRPTETFARRIVAVVPVPSVPVRCIRVDSPSHLFLAGRAMVPTHNSEVLLNYLGSRIHRDPAPMMLIISTKETAKRFSTKRIAPMIRDTSVLRSRVSEASSRTSGNTTLLKTFTGGSLVIVGANSPSDLSSDPIRDVLADEVDRYPVSAGSEGDPLSLGIQRTRNFWNRKVAEVSSPGDLETSRIWPEWIASDQRRFFVPCPHCDAHQHLMWDQVHWDKTDLEDGTTQHDASGACYVCVHCGAWIEEVDKRRMLERGEWRRTNAPGELREMDEWGKPVTEPTIGDGRFPGFHVSALYSPWVTWVEMVEIFLEKKRSIEELKTFINLQLGEPWEERDTSIDLGEASTEFYPAEVPSGVGVLTAAVDVQGDRLEVAVRGWGEGEESWLIMHERIWGDPEQPDVWSRLEHHLARKYECESGRDARIRACVIDAQFLTDTVYSFVRGKELRGVYAAHGTDGRAKEPLKRLRRPNRSRVKPWTVDSYHFKTILFRRLALTSSKDRPGGPGYMHFCAGLDAEYFAQLKAEQRRKVRSGRRFKWIIKQVRDRNEAIDLEYLNLAALHTLGDSVRRRLKELADKLASDPEEEVEEKPAAPRAPRGRKKNWATDWKR